MSKHLGINTQLEAKPYNNHSSQWQQQSSADSAQNDAHLARQKQQNTLYENGDEYEDEGLDDDSTYTSSPSIPDENINFDLVYALHTFVATVEGQASVMKGDFLTLLDDTNSYWWLISVLKTSEVGYIPAENIETPYERLARLNKYRNAEMSGIDQTMLPCIPKEQTKKKSGPQRRVTLSKDLSVQAQIILIGDDGRKEVGEAYEEWEEDMVDDHSDVTDESSIGEEKERQHQPVTSAPAPTASPTTTQKYSSIGGATYNTFPHHAVAVTAPSGPGPTATPMNANPTGTRLPGSTFWRLFSRGKKDNNGRLNSALTERVSSENAAESGSISSSISSVISEDRSTRSHMGSTSSNLSSQLTVLRVFSGNVNVGVMYHSMLVDNNTSAEELLIQAMERFHIAQIENKTAGRSSSSRTITPTNGSGIEYYLTVKPMNGDEITLDGEDRPLEIFKSLTAQLTTPMPSLSHIQQLSQHLKGSERHLSNYVRQRPTKARYGEDAIIRFYLHKRIRRVNENEGQVYVKVCLYTGYGSSTRNSDSPTTKSSTTTAAATTASTTAKLARSTFSTKSLRRKKEQPEPTTTAKLTTQQQERIDKLIAISASVTIADLIEIALDKFHIVPNSETDHYRMGVSSQQMPVEKSLSPSTKLIEVLHDDTVPRNAGEKLFMLRKTHAQPRSFRESLQLQQQQRRLSHLSSESDTTSGYRRSSMPVNNFDAKTSEILQRINSAMWALGNRSSRWGRNKGGDGTPAAAKTMAVARNTEGGLDIMIACGVLSSRSLSRNQTLYSVLTKLDDTGKLGLAVQKVIQIPSNRPLSSDGLANVTELDLDTLFTFANSYLNTHDRKINRKPVPSQSSAAATSLDILNHTSRQGSNLDYLEKEFQRIIAAHAI